MGRDYMPRLPRGGTVGTGNLSRLVNMGAKYTEKVCCLCSKKFRVPDDAYAKVFEPLRRQGNEIPCIWYCLTKQTRINGASAYTTPRPMLQFDAACYFENKLGCLALKASIHRRVYLSEDENAFPLCRTCYKAHKSDKARQWHEESIKLRRNGKELPDLKPNHGKPLPEKFDGAVLPREKAVKRKTRKTEPQEAETPRVWFCTVPSTRGEAGFTTRTGKPMLQAEARAWFRDILSRGNLSGCSVY